MAIPAIAVSVCFAISFRFEQDWHWLLLLLFKGFVMGSALGILRGVSLLCLASHYRNNFSLVSMQSGVAAMIGAASYTALAWSGLRNDHYQGLEIANFGLSFGTLALASLLLRKSKLSETLAVTMKHTQSHPPKPGNTVFHAGYLMLFFSLFVWPTFAVMLVSTPPSNQFPEFGAYVLFAAFAAGTITSIYASSAHARSKLGPVNIFIAASIVAGCSALAPAWSPYFYISLAWGCVYGAMLGAMLTLHVKVTTAFHSSGISYHPRMVRNFQVVSVASGIVAGSGVFLAGVFVQWEGGMRGVLTGYGVAMVVGGALMGVGRWLGWRGLRAVV
ncbi:hypothetical protein K458DRAFT_289350 [Lentithecium fluviatile CBS 122367]|uniref:MFS general substrate transporter n=1 Tax=Lentithecium fluviatile CBS 122367 TaxID=1168545 RepID=A0A6G1JI77_9PLEO|nr:hypothetical protein K458DRAFT_289350 [Lentithecium fluviatile CBS 122367]